MYIYLYIIQSYSTHSVDLLSLCGPYCLLTRSSFVAEVMKEINSFELIEVPEGIEASVKARAVTVKGARGTLTKVKCKNESVWRKSCAFEIKDFLHFSSYSGVQASGSRHLHAWQKDHQGADDEYVNNIAFKPSMVKLHQNSLISHLLRLRSGLERRSRSPPWGLSAVTSRTCSRASPWWDFNDKRIDEDHGIVMLMMCFVWNLQGPIGLWPRARRPREGVKKKCFFWDICPEYGWAGCIFPNFRCHIPTTIFQHKSSQVWVDGAVKAQNQIQILGEIY